MWILLHMTRTLTQLSTILQLFEACQIHGLLEIFVSNWSHFSFFFSISCFRFKIIPDVFFNFEIYLIQTPVRLERFEEKGRLDRFRKKSPDQLTWSDCRKKSVCPMPIVQANSYSIVNHRITYAKNDNPFGDFHFYLQISSCSSFEKTVFFSFKHFQDVLTRVT